MLERYFAEHLPRIDATIAREIGKLTPLVHPLARHILQSGGKRLRPILCILVAQSFGYKGTDIYPLATALELIHSATLLHDDILDQAELRRGKKAAHLLFGVTRTILTGDVLLALANKVVTSYQNVALLECISEAIFQTAVGEILEIEKMDQDELTEDEYLEIVVGKTGRLLEACCQAGAMVAGQDGQGLEAARLFGLNLGIAFQLVDDALDYDSSRETMGKPVGGDLREGKITLPLIFYLRELPENEQQRLRLAIKNGLDVNTEQKILQDINQMGLAALARKKALTFLNIAREKLSLFPSSRYQEILSQVLDFIADRRY